MDLILALPLCDLSNFTHLLSEHRSINLQVWLNRKCSLPCTRPISTRVEGMGEGALRRLQADLLRPPPPRRGQACTLCFGG